MRRRWEIGFVIMWLPLLVVAVVGACFDMAGLPVSSAFVITGVFIGCVCFCVGLLIRSGADRPANVFGELRRGLVRGAGEAEFGGVALIAVVWLAGETVPVIVTTPRYLAPAGSDVITFIEQDVPALLGEARKALAGATASAALTPAPVTSASDAR